MILVKEYMSDERLYELGFIEPEVKMIRDIEFPFFTNIYFFSHIRQINNYQTEEVVLVLVNSYDIDINGKRIDVPCYSFIYSEDYYNKEINPYIREQKLKEIGI